jgi:hypothetical protein
MKCIYCNTNSRYRERANWRCKECGRVFAFEPKDGRGMTDLRFRAALVAVSDAGRLSWTPGNLHYEAWRRIRRRRYLRRLLRLPGMTLGRSELMTMLGRWNKVHEPEPGQLAPRAFEAAEPADLDELGDIGFEHVLVCDRSTVADLLLANRFHADYRCPVLAEEGYPPRVFEALMPALRERPPTVIVVHDADWNGCGLADRIASDPRWFGGVELPRVVDAGLRPADATRFRHLRLDGDGSGRATLGLSTEEAQWLDRYRLELEAMRPRALLAVLARLLRGEVEEPDVAADGGWWWYPGTWADDDDVG